MPSSDFFSSSVNTPGICVNGWFWDPPTFFYTENGFDVFEPYFFLVRLILGNWMFCQNFFRVSRKPGQATIRCYPAEHQAEAHGRPCFLTGEPATHMALFARAYWSFTPSLLLAVSGSRAYAVVWYLATSPHLVQSPPKSGPPGGFEHRRRLTQEERNIKTPHEPWFQKCVFSRRWGGHRLGLGKGGDKDWLFFPCLLALSHQTPSICCTLVYLFFLVAFWGEVMRECNSLN